MDRSIVTICKLCGCYPIFKNPARNKIHGYIFSLILLLLFAVSNWNIVGTRLTLISKILNATILLLINLQATVTSNIAYTEKFFQFYRINDRIGRIEKNLTRKVRKGGKFFFHVKIIVAHLFFVMFEVLAYMAWGHLYLWSHLAECALTYFVLVRTILEWNALGYIFGCIRLLNDELKCINESIRIEPISLNMKTMILIDLQQQIGVLCDSFNTLYGWHIFLNLINVVQYFLSFLSVILNFQRISEFNLEAFFLINIFKVAQGVVIAAKCEEVVNEGKKSITNSYKTLHRYADVQTLREKLFILAQQATARCPKFTAAGFFAVDYSMLFTFVNLITTYVIVIIQFSNGSSTPQNASGPVQRNATTNI